MRLEGKRTRFRRPAAAPRQLNQQPHSGQSQNRSSGTHENTLNSASFFLIAIKPSTHHLNSRLAGARYPWTSPIYSVFAHLGADDCSETMLILPVLRIFLEVSPGRITSAVVDGHLNPPATSGSLPSPTGVSVELSVFRSDRVRKGSKRVRLITLDFRGNCLKIIGKNSGFRGESFLWSHF